MQLLWNDKNQSVFLNMQDRDLVYLFGVTVDKVELDDNYHGIMSADMRPIRWIISVSGHLPELAFVFDLDRVESLHVGFSSCGDKSNFKTYSDYCIVFDYLELVDFESVFQDNNITTLQFRGSIKNAITDSFVL